MGSGEGWKKRVRGGRPPRTRAASGGGRFTCRTLGGRPFGRPLRCFGLDALLLAVLLPGHEPRDLLGGGGPPHRGRPHPLGQLRDLPSS